MTDSLWSPGAGVAGFPIHGDRKPGWEPKIRLDVFEPLILLEITCFPQVLVKPLTPVQAPGPVQIQAHSGL